LQPESWPLSTSVAWFIVSPILAVLLFSAALATANVLVRHVSAIRHTIVAVETARYKAIDGLRGFLGISVFIHHIVITWFFIHGSSWQTFPNRFVLHLGQTSVALFFMITAFLFWGRVLARGSSIDWAEFFVSRLYRLYPIYFLVLGLVGVMVIALTWSAPAASVGSLEKPLLQWLLMFGTPDLNGLPHTGLLIAGVTWSLRYEWLFYLALPFFGFVAGGSRQPLAALLAVTVVAAIVYRSAAHGLFDIGILQSFLGGIVAAYWVRNPALARIGRAPASGLVAIAALLAVVMFEPTAFTWEATLGLGLFFVVVASGHSLGGVLRQPGLLWLGDITYGIYLLHGFLLWLIFQRLLPHTAGNNGIIFLMAAVAIAIVLVLLCSAVFLTIEHPAILMGKRHYQWMTHSAAALRINGWGRLRPRRP